MEKRLYRVIFLLTICITACTNGDRKEISKVEDSVIQYWLRYPEELKKCIESHYPVSDALMEKYRDRLDFGRLAENPNIRWTSNMLITYWDRFGKATLSPVFYRQLWYVWDASLIEELGFYQSKIYWDLFMDAPINYNAYEIIEAFKDQWDWKALPFKYFPDEWRRDRFEMTGRWLDGPVG